MKITGQWEYCDMELMRFDVAWAGLLAWLRISETDAWPLRGEILTQYRQPGRAYHNLSHALRVLGHVKKFAHWWGVEDYGAVQLAALLHDVVYNTRSRDNEERSAEFAVWWGRELGIAPAVYTKAAEMIRATQTHAPAESADTRLVLDADLLILASPPDEYEAYRRAIRREYAWVAEPDWVAGRRGVLESFLARAQIYQTPKLRDALEAAARGNIARELIEL